MIAPAHPPHPLIRAYRPAALSRPDGRLRVLTDLSALSLLGELAAFASIFHASAEPAPPARQRAFA